MNFSDDWRSLWPIASVFAAPNLLSSTTSLGPLLFHPSPSSSHLLLSLPPLSSHRSPVSSLLDELRSFLRSEDAFLPSSDIESLADTLLPPSSEEPFSLPSPALHALRSCRGSNLLLFFPTGENSHLIGYLSVSFEGSKAVLSLDSNGGLFTQRDGFKHPFHRITQISVSPTSASVEVSGTPDSFVEGFLIATTIYSVNWFRIETKVLELGRERLVLVPVAKQGFETCVVHACWSPHFPEESAVLLENGDLCWFNLDSMRGGTVRVSLDDGNPDGWLCCEFGGQPWILIVASSKAVILVDLRSKDKNKPRVLARIEGIDTHGVVQPLKDNRFLAFCRSSYNDFHFSVLTEHQLILFDVRQPLVPILLWDHSLDRPNYVAMLRLSELRPSDEFKWASESGFVILAGSFRSNEFSLFCYGPKEGSVTGKSSLYAWGLPSSISLSGSRCHSGDDLVRCLVGKQHLLDVFQRPQEKEVMLGFCRVPHDLMTFQLETNQVSGFSLIRLMSSGKLELQGYHPSMDFIHADYKEKDPSGVKDTVVCCKGQESNVSTMYNYLKLQYLDGYLTGNLSSVLLVADRQLDNQGTTKRTPSHHLRETICNGISSSDLSASHYVADTSIPTSIIEIASRRALASLPLDLLALAFAKYGELFVDDRRSSFELLEVPDCLPHNRFLPFLVRRPSRRCDKWLNKESTCKTLAGPVLPIPVLLALQQTDRMKKSSTLSKEEQDNDLLMIECNAVLDTLYPEISIADDCNSNGLVSSQELPDEKPFFVFEPAYAGTKSVSSSNSKATGTVKEESPLVDQACFVSGPLCKDEKFSTFICGIADKMSSSDPCKELEGSEVFNLCPIKLDFEPSSITSFQPDELKKYKCLKRQFSRWMGNNKTYQDFCSSSKIPKLAS